jgi:hypothetical protein
LTAFRAFETWDPAALLLLLVKTALLLVLLPRQGLAQGQEEQGLEKGQGQGQEQEQEQEKRY